MRRTLLLCVCVLCTLVPLQAANILVLNLDSNAEQTGPDADSSAEVFKTLLTQLGYPYDYLFVGYHDHTTLTTLDYSGYDLVLVCVGTNCLFPRAHQFSQAEGQHLVDYLTAGGRVYMEGNDVWYNDPGDGFYDFSTAFDVDPLSDGSGDLYDIRGKRFTFTDGLQFTYAAAEDFSGNCFIDHIDGVSGESQAILENTTDSTTNPQTYTLTVKYDASVNGGSYLTIASSFEFGGLIDGTGNNTKAYLLQQYLDWFGTQPSGGSEYYGDLNDDQQVTSVDQALLADYLAGNISAFARPAIYADLNGSGTVNVVDLVIMANYLVSNITSLPI